MALTGYEVGNGWRSVMHGSATPTTFSAPWPRSWCTGTGPTKRPGFLENCESSTIGVAKFKKRSFRPISSESSPSGRRSPNVVAAPGPAREQSA